MNILFTNDQPMNPHFGGIERVSDILARAMKDAGHRVYYYSFYNNNPAIFKYDFPAEMHCLPFADLSHPDNRTTYIRFLQDAHIDLIINQRGLLPEADFFISNLPEHIHVISVFHSKPFGYLNAYWDTLFANRYSLSGFCKCIVKALALPYLYAIRKRQEHQLVKQHLEWVINHSDKAVFLSNQYIDIIRHHCHVDEHKLVAIPNPNTFEETNITPKQNSILYVGRLNAWAKRPMLLLSIWKRIAFRYPDWQLIFVGDGEQMRPLQCWAKWYKLKNVRFEGIQDPRPYYEQAKINCLVSNFEGFPMVITESMQHRVVPVVFNTFGASDVIDNGETGYIIANNDTAAFTQALEELMNNEEKRQTMAENAAISVQRFHKNNIIQQWFQLLSQYSM